jgi:hypothetical protein
LALKIELHNYYMLFGWIFVIAGLMGGLYYLSGPGGQETILGFAIASFLCGIVFLYLGYTKRRVFKKK